MRRASVLFCSVLFCFCRHRLNAAARAAEQAQQEAETFAAVRKHGPCWVFKSFVMCVCPEPVLANHRVSHTS